MALRHWIDVRACWQKMFEIGTNRSTLSLISMHELVHGYVFTSHEKWPEMQMVSYEWDSNAQIVDLSYSKFQILLTCHRDPLTRSASHSSGCIYNPITCRPDAGSIDWFLLFCFPERILTRYGLGLADRRGFHLVFDESLSKTYSKTCFTFSHFYCMNYFAQ